VFSSRRSSSRTSPRLAGWARCVTVSDRTRGVALDSKQVIKAKLTCSLQGERWCSRHQRELSCSLRQGELGHSLHQRELSCSLRQGELGCSLHQRELSCSRRYGDGALSRHWWLSWSQQAAVLFPQTLVEAAFRARYVPARDRASRLGSALRQACRNCELAALRRSRARCVKVNGRARAAWCELRGVSCIMARRVCGASVRGRSQWWATPSSYFKIHRSRIVVVSFVALKTRVALLAASKLFVLRVMASRRARCVTASCRARYI
jgi:hypothetical protein